MTMFQHFNQAVRSNVLAYVLVNSIFLLGTAQPGFSKDNCRNADDIREEVATIATTNRRVSRQQDRLTIKTSQKSLVFRDICKTNFTTYLLAAYYRDLDYFLVLESGIEWHQYLLINGKTGTKTELWNKPLFSPDRRRFASTVIDELNGNTSVYIYRIDKTGVKIEYSNTDKWRPTNPAWHNDGSFEFDHNPMSATTTTRMKLEYKKNLQWEARTISQK